MLKALTLVHTEWGQTPSRCRDERARSTAWHEARARVLDSEHCAEPELPSAYPARGHVHGDRELSGSLPGPREWLPESERDRGPHASACPFPEAVDGLAGLGVCISKNTSFE